ncbi:MULTISPECIES: riboflavin synthase [unclassified Clostridium]|uniref:riboflavin synthase n=1 Tax=unclassified Clostridium TaxID=2614128 RepID=UPI0032173E4D
MFTGIVEEVGEIRGIKKGEKSSILSIKANKVIEDVKLGHSICTNGVCLTVTNIYGNIFDADVMAETLRRSNLGELKVGSKVNLERALSAKGRFGGHIVSGHIDGVGKIVSLEKEDNAIWVTIEAKENILQYIVEKGSIAIDGISLTVAYVDDKVFKVSVIPHTGKETILLSKTSEDTVNLECDVIGKYVEKLLTFQSGKKVEKKDSINEDFLKENGFL